MAGAAAPAADLTLTLDLKALGMEKAEFAAITGCRIRHVDADSVQLTVPAQWTAVVSVNRPDAAALAAAHQRELAQWRRAGG
ncbi:MAG TPA: hypothetical protein VFB21_17535 [Chthonomonadaceae bacterium]|nr:hypothetical protein [Chthonomonadaceae bacterium]